MLPHYESPVLLGYQGLVSYQKVQKEGKMPGAHPILL